MTRLRSSSFGGQAPLRPASTPSSARGFGEHSKAAAGRRGFGGAGPLHPRPPSPEAGGSRPAGFTLIELVVAVGIFMLLMGTAAGSYVMFVRSQRSSLGQAVVFGDIQTFFETLERDLRTGFGNTFSGGGATFSFKNQERQDIAYSHVNTPTVKCVARAVGGSGGCISSPNVEVRTLEFVPVASIVDPGPPPILTGQQGRVTVRLRVCPRGVNDARCVSVQATLTSRQYAAPS